MIQVTVPAHLRQRMLMGPGAEGSIFVEGKTIGCIRSPKSASKDAIEPAMTHAQLGYWAKL